MNKIPKKKYRYLLMITRPGTCTGRTVGYGSLISLQFVLFCLFFLCALHSEILMIIKKPRENPKTKINSVDMVIIIIIVNKKFIHLEFEYPLNEENYCGGVNMTIP